MPRIAARLQDLEGWKFRHFPVGNWCPRPTLKRRSWRWPRRRSPCTCSPRPRLPRWRWGSRFSCLRHDEKVQLGRIIGLHQGGCYLVLTHWIRGSSLTSRNSNTFQLHAIFKLLDFLASVNWSMVININPPTKKYTEFFGLQEEKTDSFTRFIQIKFSINI